MSGWRVCAVGGRHWGIRGAAGLLPFAVTSGGVQVLLALRSRGTHEGGTWGTIGGAIEAGETPWDAAVREAAEEADGLPLGGAEAAGSHRYDCRCGWIYTTFPVRMPGGPGVIARPGWENHELRWVPAEDVDGYRLHPGLAQSWPELRKMIETAELSGQALEPPPALAGAPPRARPRRQRWHLRVSSSHRNGAVAYISAAPDTPLPATPLKSPAALRPRISEGCSGCW